MTAVCCSNSLYSPSRGLSVRSLGDYGSVLTIRDFTRYASQ